MSKILVFQINLNNPEYNFIGNTTHLAYKQDFEWYFPPHLYINIDSGS